MIFRIKILNISGAMLGPLNATLSAAAAGTIPLLLFLDSYIGVRRYSIDAYAQLERTEVELHNVTLKKKYLALLKDINTCVSRDISKVSPELIDVMINDFKDIVTKLESFQDMWTKDTTNILKYHRSLLSIADKNRESFEQRDRDRFEMIYEKTRRSL